MTKQRRLARRLIACAVAVGIAAGCGGDDDSAENTSASAVPEATVPATTVPVSTVPVTTVPVSTVLVTTAPAATAAPPSTQPVSVFTAADGWIAYQTFRGSEQVWLVRPDGSENHRIGEGASLEQLLPDWTPDGNYLIVATRGELPEQLHRIDVATGETLPLFECVDQCLGEDEPAVSPDGTKVVFVRAIGPIVDDVPSECGLWVGEIATGIVTQITSNRPCDPREWMPRWSPDGTQIAFWDWREEPLGNTTGTAVFIANADGSGERQLTEYDLYGATPDWSPDGEWIVFGTYPLNAFDCCEASDIYRIHPDGSGLEQLTAFGSADVRAAQPRYRPDGEWIVFTLVTPESRTISAIPAEGGEPVVITDDSEFSIYTHPAWQPTADGYAAA